MWVGAGNKKVEEGLGRSILELTMPTWVWDKALEDGDRVMIRMTN